MAEIRRNILRVWNFAREYNDRGNLEPLPSYLSIAFNPKMALCIRNHSDLVVRVMGHCVEALVVNKLAADISSRDVPVGIDELSCLSAILGTKSDDVKHLLNHPCAIEFTNMLLFSPGHPYPIFGDPVPSYVLDVIQQTSSALSRALPHRLNTEMQQNQAQSMMNIFDGGCELYCDPAQLSNDVPQGPHFLLLKSVGTFYVRGISQGSTTNPGTWSLCRPMSLLLSSTQRLLITYASTVTSLFV